MVGGFPKTPSIKGKRMSSGPFSTLLIRIMRPVVRLLLRYGIAYKTASAAIKWCYVDVATRDFAVDGKQTKARVAVITGLTRIEVEKLQREPAPAAHDNSRSHHRAARVLTGWSADPRYLDLQGRPLRLPVDGATPSFAALAASQREHILAETLAAFRAHCGEINEDTMPGELANVIAGRVANLFNFRGPNFTTDAACASGLAATSHSLSMTCCGGG